MPSRSHTLTHPHIHPQTDPFTHRPIHQQTHPPTDPSTNRPIHQQTHTSTRQCNCHMHAHTHTHPRTHTHTHNARTYIHTQRSHLINSTFTAIHSTVIWFDSITNSQQTSLQIALGNSKINATWVLIIQGMIHLLRNH